MANPRLQKEILQICHSIFASILTVMKLSPEIVKIVISLTYYHCVKSVQMRTRYGPFYVVHGLVLIKNFIQEACFRPYQIFVKEIAKIVNRFSWLIHQNKPHSRYMA